MHGARRGDSLPARVPHAGPGLGGDHRRCGVPRGADRAVEVAGRSLHAPAFSALGARRIGAGF